MTFTHNINLDASSVNDRDNAAFDDFAEGLEPTEITLTDSTLHFSIGDSDSSWRKYQIEESLSDRSPLVYPNSQTQDVLLASLQTKEVKTDTDNPLEKIFEGDFDANVKAFMTGVASENAIMAWALEAFTKQNYQFVLYTPGSSEVPADIVSRFESSNGMIPALTVKEDKKVYIDYNSLITTADILGVTPERSLEMLFVHEGAHVVRPWTFTPVADGVEELRAIAIDPKQFIRSSEQDFRGLILEETVSKVVEEVYAYQRDPSIPNLTLEDILEGNYYRIRLKQIKMEYFVQAGIGVYGLEAMQREDLRDSLIGRNFDFLNSGEIEAALKAQLSQPPFSM